MLTIPQGMDLRNFVSREIGRACSYSRLARQVYNGAADLYGKLSGGGRPVLREQINTARALDQVWHGQLKYELAYPVPGLRDRSVDTRRLIDSHDYFIVDVFGTCKDETGYWEEATGALRTMVRTGKKVVIVSNTADFSVQQNREQLLEIGIDLPLDQIVTSGQILRPFFQLHSLTGRPVLSIGNEVTAEYVELAGARPVTDLAGDFDAVVLSYLDAPLPPEKLDALKARLTKRDIPIILANTDMFLPASRGSSRTWP